MSSDPLWCEVFMEQAAADSDSGEEEESSSDELLRQHKKLILGMQSSQKIKNDAGNRVGLASAKLPLTKPDSAFTLPPILRPLLNDEPKKKKKKPVEGT